MAKNEEHVIKPEVNPDIWFKIFHARSIFMCIMEMIKNGLDWKSANIGWFTNEDRTKIRYIDDGRGMSLANRIAFLSVGMSNAYDDDQTGVFGTGAKYLIFTFCSYVKIVTAPQEDPDRVWIFEFTPEDLANAYNGGAPIPVRSEPKTSENWPHEHPFGVDATYTLKDPSSRSIYRDDALARELSTRLNNSLVTTGIVKVNGQRLPEKKVKGQTFDQIWVEGETPGLGEVRLEFYRPEKLVSQDLMMTDSVVPEVSFRDSLIPQLPPELKAMIPELFFDKKVCGQISAKFLKDHVNESRDRYEVTILDDERLMVLIRLLGSVEANVAKDLGIKLASDEPSDDGKEELAEILVDLRERFVQGPTRHEEIIEGPPEGPPRGGSSGGRVNPWLEADRDEYEIDETITVLLKAPKGVSTEGFTFYTDQSKAKVDTMEAERLVLKANELGAGMVHVAKAQTGQNAVVEYEVVGERFARLSSSQMTIEQGSSATIRIINPDKLDGQPEWMLESGSGEIKTRDKGHSVVFTSDQLGKSKLVMKHGGNQRLYCGITTVPPEGGGNGLWIRDKYLEFEIAPQRPREPEFQKIAMIFEGDEVHRVISNPFAPGYQEALKSGSLRPVFLQSLSVEFARVFLVDIDECAVEDIPQLTKDIQTEAAEVFAEMISE